MTKEIDFTKFGSLIKWPQCVIVGEKVTPKQAADILARTDMFFFGFDGNNHKLNEELYKTIGLRNDFNMSDYPDTETGRMEWQKYMDQREEFFEKAEILDLNYLDNGWVSNAYIGGVHGWCWPDGTIFDNQNIGKWPEWEDVYNDLVVIAKEFPFLKMKLYLFNQEHDCEEYYSYPRACVGGFAVENGEVFQLEENEWIPGNSPLCASEDMEERCKKLTQIKKELFGNDHAITHREFFMGTENFFNVEEFKEYFKGHFGL